MKKSVPQPAAVAFTVEHRGKQYPVIPATAVPPNYTIVTDPVYLVKEKDIFESMWDRMRTEDCILVDFSDKHNQAVSIFRHDAELNPWRTGGFTNDDDGMRVSIGLRDGLRPHIMARLTKFISCFHA